MPKLKFMTETSTDEGRQQPQGTEPTGYSRDKVVLTRKRRQYNTLPVKDVGDGDIPESEKRQPRKSFDISVVPMSQVSGTSSGESTDHSSHGSRMFKISRVKNERKISGALSCQNVPTLDKLVMEISVTPAPKRAEEYDPLIDIF